MFQVLVAALLISLASADSVKFTDCAKMEAQMLNITGCMGDMCSVKNGAMIDVVETFMANQDTAKVMFKLTASIGALEVTLPDIEPDACKQLACPLKKGMTYMLKESLKVEHLPTGVTTVVTGTLTGDMGVLSCLKASVMVQA